MLPKQTIWIGILGILILSLMLAVSVPRAFAGLGSNPTGHGAFIIRDESIWGFAWDDIEGYTLVFGVDIMAWCRGEDPNGPPMKFQLVVTPNLPWAANANISGKGVDTWLYTGGPIGWYWDCNVINQLTPVAHGMSDYHYNDGLMIIGSAPDMAEWPHASYGFTARGRLAWLDTGEVRPFNAAYRGVWNPDKQTLTYHGDLHLR